MRIGSLFSGYGGLDHAAADVFGAEVAWVSDIDPGACKILAHRYPDVPNLGDITAVDWSAVEPVDIITGGSPCQDLSHAGRRAGMTDGTRSNLWAAMREAIAVLKPAYVVWENVHGSLSASADSALEHCPGCMGDPRDRGAVLRALGRVLGDLADLGYDAQWHGLRASDLGACHHRFRVFVVAHARGEHRQQRRLTAPGQAEAGRSFGELAGRDRAPVALLPTPTTRDTRAVGTADGFSRRSASHAQPLPEVVAHLLPTPRATDGIKGGPNQRGSSGGLMLPSAAHAADWGPSYAPAIDRHERFTGRPAPAPTETGPKGGQQLSPRFVEWMMGLPAGWVTDTPELTRSEALKALGNGVVPPQAAHALRVCLGRTEAIA